MPILPSSGRFGRAAKADTPRRGHREPTISASCRRPVLSGQFTVAASRLPSASERVSASPGRVESYVGSRTLSRPRAGRGCFAYPCKRGQWYAGYSEPPHQHHLLKIDQKEHQFVSWQGSPPALASRYRGTRRGNPLEDVDNRGAHIDGGGHLPTLHTTGPGCRSGESTGDTPRDRKGRVKARARGPSVGAAL